MMLWFGFFFLKTSSELEVTSSGSSGSLGQPRVDSKKIAHVSPPLISLLEQNDKPFVQFQDGDLGQ